LVGWQIYKTIDVDKKIEDKSNMQDKKVKDIEDKFENKLKDECKDSATKIFTDRSKNIDRIEYSNELYFSINEAQFYFVLKNYTKSYERYLS
jgi:argininosuccinate lyase